MDVFTKRHLTVRYRLLGRADIDPSWNLALQALEYASHFHKGTRKDGVTPEYDHQLGIAQLLFGFPNILHPVETMAAVCLHDTAEDASVGYEEIEAKFGKAVRDPVERLTKEYRGVKKPTDVYYAENAKCPVASVAKGLDRVHNLQSMNNKKPDGSPAFSLEKQKKYIAETREFVLPMLKAARRLFPAQEFVYEAVKSRLEAQIQTLEVLHEHWEALAPAETETPRMRMG